MQRPQNQINSSATRSATRRHQQKPNLMKSYSTAQSKGMSLSAALGQNIGGQATKGKSVQDLIRSLRQDLERKRDDNEELRSEVQQRTQEYLLEKQKVQELTQQIGFIKQGKSSQIKNFKAQLENQIQIREQQNFKIIEEQQKMIEKYRTYKICLSKNVYDLQERLRATKHELQLTQKQLYSTQGPQEPEKIKPELNEAARVGRKTNQIGILPSEFGDKYDQNLDSSIIRNRRQPKKRNDVGGVAKSLHVAKNTMNDQKKYDWLFNEGEEETPRQMKRDDGQTTNTGTKHGDEVLMTDTLVSERTFDGETQLIKRNRHKGEIEGSDGIVTKSLQNMKNMFSKVRDVSQNGRQSIIGTVNKPTNHENIEFNFVEKTEIDQSIVTESIDNPLDDSD